MYEKKDELESDIFIPVIESLITNLKTRLGSYTQTEEKFSFLSQLGELNLNEISTACKKVASFYTDDVDEKELISECEIAKQYFFSDSTTFVSYASIYSRIFKDELQTIFPNIEVLLRIFVVIIYHKCARRAFLFKIEVYKKRITK